MLKHVILDMGNVLLDYDPDISLNRFCSSKEEREVILKELFHGPEWKLGDRGDIKDAERYYLIKGRVPEQFHKALKNCAEQWDICMKPIAGAREFCEYVKAQGYGIYVLSNASDAFYRYFPPFLPLDFFDGVFVSSDYHMLKPDPEIYEAFLAKYGLRGEECLFIDDLEKNLAGARTVGMQTFCFTGDYEAVKETMKRLSYK
ncbi:MAG: HAD family phosphatase [Lachnospiraceae bacterium]|nr:HAD family phosphatase [Lachnospiraceae bacterium]